MGLIIIETVWFFLPAMIANMAPIFAARYGWLTTLDKPLDAGRALWGRRLLGDNKTVRGLIIAIIFGSTTGFFQYLLFSNQTIESISLIPYTPFIWAIAQGASLAFGAIVGDAVGSFFKRQRDISPGASWPIFDQIDFVVGALVVGSLFAPLSIAHVVTAIMVIGFGSYLTSVIGVALRIKKNL